LGNNAVHAAMAGKTKCVVGLVHDKYDIIPTEMVTRKRNTVDPEGALWRDALDATGQPILMVNNIQSVIEHMRKTAEEEEKKAQAKSK
jgi:6-phosphofructokinase 1